MIIDLISEQKLWDGFLKEIQPHTFLHSWNWGEFNQATGNKIFRLGIWTNDHLVGVALIIKIKAKRGAFLFCPHGPIITSITNYQLLITKLSDYLKNLAKKENCSFIRLSPLFLKTPENGKLFKDLGFRPAPIHMHPELAWLLDLRPAEDELLKNMRKTTRYCIRQAEKQQVKIIKSINKKDIDIFYRIYQETTNRHHFIPFSKEYLKKEFEVFIKDNQALLFFGQYQNRIISAAMIIFNENSAFYHHGASSKKFNKVPASYLLQWEAIKEAKNRGLKFYNFWGIAPENTKAAHPWHGLSLFKKGFGGFSEDYVHAQDLVLNYKYWFTFLIEKLRKAKRHL